MARFEVTVGGAYMGRGVYKVGKPHTAAYNALRWASGKPVELKRGEEITITVRRIDQPGDDKAVRA